MKNITLQEMFKLIIDSILKNEERPTFYYKRQNWDTGNPEFVEITEVDLLDTRYKTIDNDFSEFEWDLIKSNIYINKSD